MLKEIKSKTTEIIERVVKTEYYCDRCQKEYDPHEGDGYYTTNKNKIEFVKETSYPDISGDIEGEEAYLCKKCMYKIKEILEQNGVKFEKIDKSW